jgi:cytochrome c-type biogenesis protein
VGVPLLALVGLGGVGWLVWTYAALPGLTRVEFAAPWSLAVVGFMAGIGAFFAPCAFALFPGYVSYYLTAAGDRGGVGRALVLGLACGAGGVVFFAAVGTIITLAGGAISPYLIATKPFVALAVVALGVVQLADVRLPTLAVPRRLGPSHGLPVTAAVFLCGFGYALASTGCTLPLYVSITVLPLTSGYRGAALLTFLAFAGAMALLMLVTTVLVGLARQDLVRALQGSVVGIKRASGVVLILAGLYLGYYYVRAGM